ncbi:unnamed protein product [Taenia asiatica]|uniref:DUF5733 domain-containing protein n=1 Tax=Taenia asiatica TaxID=60517 RepID=A0A0R3W156_TAEAS|nr:unnamed protein product [Taenia asiatica]
MSVIGSQRLSQMAKETRQDKEGTKKPKDEDSKKKKADSSKAPLMTAECQLRKMIKDKKKKKYSVDEVKDIYSSVKEPKSGFLIYLASIYPDKVAFKPTEKGKKLKPVKYANIGQIIQVPDDLQSFLIHVPKSKKAKPFTALFTWLDPQMPKRFEKIVRQPESSPVKAPHEGSDENAQNGNNRPKSNTSDVSGNESPLTQLQTAPYFAASRSSSAYGAKDSSSDIIRAPKRFSETYTHYCPNRTLCRSVQDFSGSTCSSDSSYDEDSDDSDYICRDKGSVFYGERMSPKSQYIDRLMRTTVKMQNESHYS